jgi:hypothetical protein
VKPSAQTLLSRRSMSVGGRLGVSLDHGDFDVAKEEAGNVARYASGLEHLLATISDYRVAPADRGEVVGLAIGGQACSIRSHPARREQIDTALVVRTPYREITGRFGVS